MKTDRLMVIMMYIVLAGVFLNAILDMYLANADKIPIGGPNFSDISIQKSLTVFIAYQVWMMLLSGTAMISFHFKTRTIFLISVLLLLILFFYPKMTV